MLQTRILRSKPNTGLLFRFVLLASLWCMPHEAHAQGDSSVALIPKLSIGVTEPFGAVIHSPLDNSIIAPYYAPWDNVRNHAMVAQLKASGFETVRLVVGPAGLLTATEMERQEIYKSFRIGITDILNSGLKVVFDMHVEETNPAWNNLTIVTSLSDGKFQQYDATIGSVARFISEFDPHLVALELFNEPPGPCRTIFRPQWEEFQKELFHTARVAAPNTTIVLTGPCLSAPEGIDKIHPNAYDANTVYAVHYYLPGIFTFQGAYWMSFGPKFLRRIPYPPTTDRSDEIIAAADAEVNEAKDLDAAGKARAIEYIEKSVRDYFHTPMDKEWMSQQLAPTLRWADENGVSRERIWIGEFGTMRDAYNIKTAATEDRLRWFEDVISLFDRAGVSWSVWTLFGGMGISTGDEAGSPDPRVLEALGLKTR
jgi:endoglucanase